MNSAPLHPRLLDHASDRWIAATIGAIGLVIGLGGADEFRYFGSSTPQFWAGAIAAPAGAIAIAAAVQLWRRAASALSWVRAAAVALLIATVGGVALRVMGPPAMLLGLIGVLASGWWVRRRAIT